MFTFAKENTPSYPALEQVSLGEGEWKDWLEKVYTVTATDVLNKFEKEGILENYRMLAAGKTGNHRGLAWYHGLINETIRGIGDFLTNRRDAAMEARLDAIIDLMGEAMDEEGYLNPFVSLLFPNRRWGRNGGNSLQFHETYNAGCLIEAGVHYYRSTGKKKLLAMAVKNANYLSDFIGYAPKHNVACEHSLAEEALVKLAEVFEADAPLAEELGARPEEYLRLSRFLLDNKGNTVDRWSQPQFLREYAQDVCPARDQKDAMGHAVRANLLYTGMAKLALHDQDEGLALACRRIWKDIVTTKLHFNGCVGTERGQENYGYAYDLPNNAYLETCAGVGLAFFGAGMFSINGEASVWDTVENTLYNTLRASLSDSFDHYTYENPLMHDGSLERWKWHACPCCPPMILKLAGMLPQLVFAQNKEELWLNLWIPATLQGEGFSLRYADGALSFGVKKGSIHKKLHLRIPEWIRDLRLYTNEEEISYTVERGYAIVEGAFADGDRIRLEYRVPLVKYEAHPFVKADAKKVAVKYGPVLYCCERVDNTGAYGNYVLTKESKLTLREDRSIEVECKGDRKAVLVPYYQWGNRSRGRMWVWNDQEGMESDPEQNEAWEGKLYRPYREYNAE